MDGIKWSEGGDGVPAEKFSNSGRCLSPNTSANVIVVVYHPCNLRTAQYVSCFYIEIWHTEIHLSILCVHGSRIRHRFQNFVCPVTDVHSRGRKNFPKSSRCRKFLWARAEITERQVRYFTLYSLSYVVYVRVRVRTCACIIAFLLHGLQSTSSLAS